MKATNAEGMEQYCIPNADRIIEAVRTTLSED